MGQGDLIAYSKCATKKDRETVNGSNISEELKLTLDVEHKKIDKNLFVPMNMAPDDTRSRTKSQP